MLDAFFHTEDQRLIAEFRDNMARMELKAQLAEASGLHDDEILDRLVELNVRPDTLAAVSLVPLVVVAWADGSIPARQREAVLAAAEQAGIHRDDEAYRMLEHWLTQKPDSRMLETWKSFIAVNKGRLEPADAERLKQDILGRARQIAEATGGILGIGKISAKERAILAELEQAFS
jgi:DnaJ-domain-containing protein 1